VRSPSSRASRALFVGLLVGTACRPSAPAADADVPKARFLALGDSFTIGTGATPDQSFPARLAATWTGAGCAVDLRNVAVNGYTTDDLIARELPEVERFQPTFVTVAIGANDIVRRRSPEAYRANLKTIFGALAAVRAGGGRIVAIPQPDWSRSPAAAPFGEPAALWESIKAFNAILEDEATVSGAAWVDLSPLMLKQADGKMLANDGLHPSAPAYGAWAEALAQRVAKPCKPAPQ
jgi:lysophospholipase L1-like esterase